MWKENEETERTKPLRQLESDKLPGHLTIFSVRILVVGVNSFYDSCGVIPVNIFNCFTQVEILNWEMVISVFKRSTH